MFMGFRFGLLIVLCLRLSSTYRLGKMVIATTDICAESRNSESLFELSTRFVKFPSTIHLHHLYTFAVSKQNASRRHQS